MIDPLTGFIFHYYFIKREQSESVSDLIIVSSWENSTVTTFWNEC